jgi:hypothetical protein
MASNRLSQTFIGVDEQLKKNGLYLEDDNLV